ncbi:MAG: alkaline phosphatase family protein, partial [Caldilineales bacterium]|nr:alkaline phosphatase family protein [Caldilineales bacterium]
MPEPRLLILALNGASHRLLTTGVGVARLPKLAQLADRWGPLAAPLPVLDYPAWASFYSGVDPGTHRVYGFSQLDPAGRPGRLAHVQTLPVPTWPALITARGYRLIGLFAPMTTPPPSWEGPVIGDRPTGTDGLCTYPAGLAAELTARFGPLSPPAPRQFFPATGLCDEGAIRAFLAAQARSLAQTATLARVLLSEHPWDVALVHVYPVDTVSHALWHYLDGEHPAHRCDSAIGAQLETFFGQLDALLSDLITTVRPANTLVFADHGFAPCLRILNVDRALAELTHTWQPPLGLRLRSRLRGYDPKTVMTKALRSEHKVVHVNRHLVSETRLAEVIAGLENMVDPQTGKTAIARVWRSDELYPAARTDEFCPLILAFSPGYT